MVAPANLLGQRFGRLTATERSGSKHGKALWRCICDCGRQKYAKTEQLRSSATRSCGCLQIESRLKHGHARRSGRSPEYEAWDGMIVRCSCPSHNSYPRYGGRGITVCPRWRISFENFLADVGRKPTPKHSLGRIDNNKGYEPGNVRWETWRQQCSNTRRSRFIEINGERKTLAEWARAAGLSYAALRTRIVRGWPPARAISTPSRYCV